MKYKKLSKYILMCCAFLVIIFSGTTSYSANVTPGTEPEEGLEDPIIQDDEGFSVGITLDSNSDSTTLSGTLQILLVITIISIAPSILVMVTSFTRIIVVFHFLRTAVGTQSSPPNNVLVGLSLFLTLFIMSPVFSEIKTEGIDKLNSGEVSKQEAINNCIKPVREFMLNQVRQDDLRLFMDMAKMDTVDSLDEIPITVVIPAFITSELRAAFIIGFLIYIPFIIIDMVVASVLMSMGMMMLPPTTISMPFKILLFILADGWNLIIGELVSSFNL